MPVGPETLPFLRGEGEEMTRIERLGRLHPVIWVSHVNRFIFLKSPRRECYTDRTRQVVAERYRRETGDLGYDF